MKRTLLSLFGLALLLGPVAEAQAQAGLLVHGIASGITLLVGAASGKKANKTKRMPDVSSMPAAPGSTPARVVLAPAPVAPTPVASTPEEVPAPVVLVVDPAIPRITYRGQEFARQRTAADQLPRKGRKEITAVEAVLESCHTALLADSTSAVCSAAQRNALQTAMRNLANTQPEWSQTAYQQEANFYLTENQRRRSAAPTGRR